MATPFYDGDKSIKMLDRPCAAPAEEFGTCQEAATTLGVDPDSSWTQPCQGGYGWVCAAHERVIQRLREPEREAAHLAQLEAEGREFWQDYGSEAGETPHVSRRQQALDSLNSDT
jgi:hypothetical protein